MIENKPKMRFCYNCGKRLYRHIGIRNVRWNCTKCGKSYHTNDGHSKVVKK